MSREEKDISTNRGTVWTPRQKTLALTHILQSSCPGVLLLEAERVETLSASKVHDLDGVEVGHHDVVGLQVQVEDTPAVEVLDSLQDLHQVARNIILGVAEPFSEDTNPSLNLQ